MFSFRSLRLLLIVVGLDGIVLCIVLLMNFIALNPTGRRYSSSHLTSWKTSNEMVDRAQRILSDDLGFWPNDEYGNGYCICGRITPDPDECRICVATMPDLDTFLRPDFYTRNFIIEVVNSRDLTYTEQDLPQLKNYVSAAKKLKIQLWVYVRKDLPVDEKYRELVESTGGGIVPYFTTPGYHDPVNSAALLGLVGCTVALGGSTAWELRLWGRSLSARASPSANTVAG